MSIDFQLMFYYKIKMCSTGEHSAVLKDVP